jgi:signal transduction histidine kinase
VIGFLTPEARGHIRRLALAVRPHAVALERQFCRWLRQAGYEAAQQESLLAITPVAAAGASSLQRFLAQTSDHGRRLAKLNLSPLAASAALQQFDSLLEPMLEGHFAPAREQLRLATHLALQDAFYQVREGEAQTLFALYRAEAEARDLHDFLQRLVGLLAQAFQASAGQLVLEKIPRALARPRYVLRGQNAERLIAASLRSHCASYWCYPLGELAVIELGFERRNPWLPRERTLLAAASIQCKQAMERTRMAAELRQLAMEFRRAEEEERRRIGRDLHDEAAQAIAALRLQLDLLGRDAPPALRPRLLEARDLAASTAIELRRIVAALSPAALERLGLEGAIRQLVDRFRRLCPATVRLRGLFPGHLSRRTEEVIYRIAQECLQNVVKHSHATVVKISLVRADPYCKLSVCDNGIGFCVERLARNGSSFGLWGMRQRAAELGGTLTVHSRPGKGTQISLELPIDSVKVGTWQKFEYC